MKLLQEIHDRDLLKDADTRHGIYNDRKLSVRAVVINSVQKIALVYIKNRGYHKLPGGGVEDGESIAASLKRELREEVGCEVTLLHEVGRVIEYRDRARQMRDSYCWIARSVGELQEPQLTQDEKEKGLEIQWMGLEEAINVIRGEKVDNYFGIFIHARELAFLTEAKRIIDAGFSP
ncbi:MAG: NUDIX domain-containing protein [Patescibacteria group bacterium]